MSGPKIFRTPRFTTAVFDGKLQILFALQGRVALLAEVLRARSSGPGGGAAADVLAETQPERDELLRPFRLGDRGEFGEAIRHAFELHIDGHTERLTALVTRLEQVLPPGDPSSGLAGADPQAAEAPARTTIAMEAVTTAPPPAVDPKAPAVALRARLAGEVASREREFLRRHVVEALERLGYRSISEMRVLDFSRPAHHLMKVAGQDNFVGLRFGDDDTMVYRFLVPEAPEQLDAAARRRKVAEMEESCRTFQRVLLDLAVLGVPLELERAVPASEQALLTLPERYRDEVRASEASATDGTGRGGRERG